MKKFFKWLLITVAVLATGVVVLLYNPALVKGPLERQLSKLTGYPLSLGGDIFIDVGRTTELSLTDLRIAAPEWSENPDLGVIGQVQLKLNTASVFADTVLIDALGINDVTVNLETREDGEKNWVAESRATQKTADESPPAVLFRDIELNAATLTHLDREREVRRVIHINTLSQQHLPDGMLAVDLDGGLNGQPVGFSGVVGPYANLLKGRDVSFNGQGEFGNAIFNGEALIDDLVKPHRPVFELDMAGPDIDQFTTMMGWDDLGTGGFSLLARGGVVEDRFEAGLTGELGDLSLNLSLLTDTLSNLDELELELAANGPDLGAFTSVFGADHWPHEPFDVRGNARRVGHTLDIPNLRLDIGGTHMVLDALLSNFPTLDTGRIKLHIQGDDIAPFRDLLGIEGVANGDFEIRGSLDVSPDGEELVQVDMHTAWGKMTLSGILGDAPDYNDSRFELHLEGDDAHRLMSMFDIDALPREPYNLDARIVTAENGLVLERGALATVGDKQLEINGLVSLDPGSKGTDIELDLTGQHLGDALHRLVGPGVADLPYHVSGRVRVDDEGIRL
ncbi:MAG: AsmA family protein, partial [Lysobacterales bacterium]